MISFFKRVSIRSFLIAQIIIPVAFLFVISCAAGKKSIISQNELTDQIKSGNPPTIVDVRSSDDYETGHLPGAIHIPYWAIFTRHSKIPSAHEEPLIIYCEHGPRATLAKLELRIVGFQEILYLEGHMSSWKEANLQIEKSASP
ncbi:MAG: rhodanese-like domain-containing protein [Desulfobacterales bacterium]